jgi:hypothetical protein
VVAVVVLLLAATAPTGFCETNGVDGELISLPAILQNVGPQKAKTAWLSANPWRNILGAVDALRGLMQQWRNYPSSWNSGDPCGGGWDGVMCSNGRVTSL